MGKTEWQDLAEALRRAHAGMQRKVKEFPGYDPTITAVYVLDALAFVAEDMSNK